MEATTVMTSSAYLVAVAARIVSITRMAARVRERDRLVVRLGRIRAETPWNMSSWMSAAVVAVLIAGCGGGGTPTTTAFVIGGTVSGLSGSGLVLQNNGGNSLPIGANGNFVFTMPIASGSAYSVTVLAQPATPSQTCAVSNGAGTATANVTDVAVVCGCTPPEPVNLVTNGSFEANHFFIERSEFPRMDDVNGSEPMGWTRDSGALAEYMARSPTYLGVTIYNPADGEYFIGPHDGEWWEQTFATIPSTRYRLTYSSANGAVWWSSFYYRPGIAPGSVTLVGNATRFSGPLAGTAAPPSGTTLLDSPFVWSQHTVDFTADSNLTTVRFAGPSEANGGFIFIDAVSVIAQCPAPVAVPDVVGKSREAAATAINQAGLVVGTVTLHSSSTVAAGEVISESPAAGSIVLTGSAVDLVVADPCLAGGQPSVSIDVPPTGASQLSGLACNVDTTRIKVVIYVLTDQWYVQPLIVAPFTDIAADGAWTNFTHPWNSIVVLLVDPASYTPAATEIMNPALDPRVLAWAQYPPSPTSVDFSGRTWGIKVSGERFDPGPNYWSSDPSVVHVAADGLHLKIAQIAGKWQSAEVYLLNSLGYGTYTVQVSSRVDQLDQNTVAAPLFIYAAPGQELDNEYGGSGGLIPDPDNAQFVVQPFTVPGNIVRYVQPPAAQFTTQMEWRADHVTFRSWTGWSTDPEASEIIHQWTYEGLNIPPPGQERVRMNLWLLNGNAPVGNVGDEMVINSFTYLP